MTAWIDGPQMLVFTVLAVGLVLLVGWMIHRR
jgi:hypothetical protein